MAVAPKSWRARLAHIQSLDPERDYHEIYYNVTRQDFRVEARVGLLLAFWRIFAIPAIAEQAVARGGTIHRTAKRSDDSGIMLYELLDYGLDHPRGQLVVRRMDAIHRRFAITTDDFRYGLGAQLFMPIRWIDRYGWRPLCCHERTAAFVFHRELGRRLQLPDQPDSYEAFETWFDAYERGHFAYTDAAAQLLAATRDTLDDRAPAAVSAGIRRYLPALLDPPMRAATGTPDPSWMTTTSLDLILRARARLLRLRPPRPRPHRGERPLRAPSYPDGYDLKDIGAEAAGF